MRLLGEADCAARSRIHGVNQELDQIYFRLRNLLVGPASNVFTKKVDTKQRDSDKPYSHSEYAKYTVIYIQCRVPSCEDPPSAAWDPVSHLPEAFENHIAAAACCTWAGLLIFKSAFALYMFTCVMMHGPASAFCVAGAPSALVAMAW